MNVSEHIFTCLAEEAAEVIQASTKCLRFAIEGSYPDGKGNIEVLVAEINDVLAVIEMMQEYGINLPKLGDPEHIANKKAKVKDHMKLAYERGALY